MPSAPRGSHRLRTGRVTIANATYFLTLCTSERRSGLAQNSVFDAFCRELSSLKAECKADPRAFVLMPEHLHLIVTISGSLALSKIVARLKSKVAPVLRAAAMDWQPGFHDHRLRPGEPLEFYFRYLHRNPYEAGLCPPAMQWPFVWFAADDWAWFQSCTEEGAVLPEWLRKLP